MENQNYKEFYHMRWGEESSFRDLKYTLGLLYFHAKKRQYAEQEIYAGLVRFNFCGAIANHVDSPAPRKNKERKYDYKICFHLSGIHETRPRFHKSLPFDNTISDGNPA